MRLAGPLPIGGWIQDPEGYSWGKYPRPASPCCLESPWHCMRQTEQIWFLPLSATLIGAADRAAYEHGHLLEAKAICDWGVIKPVGRGSPPSTSCTSTHGPRWYLGCPDCIWPGPYLRAVLATSKPEIWQCLSRTGWLTACDKKHISQTCHSLDCRCSHLFGHVMSSSGTWQGMKEPNSKDADIFKNQTLGNYEL